MEDIKDIQKTVQNTDSISRFLDGHTVRSNPFGDNRAAERAYRRAERIAAALYLVTNHIPDAEPAKLRLRTLAAKLLPDMLALRDDMRAPFSSAVAASLSDLRQLISLVRVLSVGGYISLQNAGTVVEALDELGLYLTASQRSVLSENITLTREDLMDIQAAPQFMRPAPVSSVKDTRTPQRVKDSGSVKDGSQMSVSKPLSGARSQHIVEILRTGGSLGIRDIAANLPEYGEKTIQRELLDLVGKGVVRKIGLKRWSKYTLAEGDR